MGVMQGNVHQGMICKTCSPRPTIPPEKQCCMCERTLSIERFAKAQRPSNVNRAICARCMEESHCQDEHVSEDESEEEEDDEEEALGAT